jgi:hypothetical protein
MPGLTFVVVGERNKVWNSNSNQTDCTITNTFIVEFDCPSTDAGGGGGGGSGDKRKRYDANACYTGIVTYNYLVTYYKNVSLSLNYYDYPTVNNYVQGTYKIWEEVFCWFNKYNPNDMELSLKIGAGFTITGTVFIGAGIVGIFVWCTILLIFHRRNGYQSI